MFALNPENLVNCFSENFHFLLIVKKSNYNESVFVKSSMFL